MFTRKIGKILRGQATPLQVMMACVLGSMIGFVPGFLNGPGLMIALILLLVILNANLGVALLMAMLGKLLGLALMPVSFAVGRVLLDGPTQGLFKSMINAPVLALFGFEHYATTGGMAVGLLLGILAGFVVNGSVGRFRKAMAGLEENSEAFKRITSSFLSRSLMFIFIGGGHGKKTYGDMLAKKAGNPFRVMGVVFSLLVVGLLFLASRFLSGPIVTAALKNGLERVNGATVDVQSVDLNLKEGRLTVTGLAMADPNALGEDIFRAASIVADIAGADLLRKRLKLDTVMISEGSSGDTRTSPGRIIGKPPAPEEADDRWVLQPGEKTIDDYIQTATKWKERLAQARKWLEKVSGEPDGDGAGEETLSDRLARQVAEMGYARVIASHLIDDTPTLLIGELVAQGVRVNQLQGEVLDIRAENLSTQPHLVVEPMSVTVDSRSGLISFETSTAAADGVSPGRIALTIREMSIDEIAKNLSVGGERLMQGGTMDVVIDGTWSSFGVGYLDLPLQVILHDTTISLPGAGSSPIERLELPIALRGPMDDPRITVDENLLADALVAAGADRLAAEVQGEADKLLDKVADELGEEAKGALGDALKGLLPGGKKKDEG